jgi:hypothetical protein
MVSPRVPLYPHLVPNIALTCTNDRPAASAVTRRPCLYRPVLRGPASSGGKLEGNPGCDLTREFHAYFLPAFVSPTAGRKLTGEVRSPLIRPLWWNSGSE